MAGKTSRKSTKLPSSQAATLRSRRGDVPVQAYIAAMPAGNTTSAAASTRFIVRTVPDVRKAVKWNSPFYGIENQGWFLNFHLLREVHQSGVLPYVAAPLFLPVSPAPGSALPRHPRGRPARRKSSRTDGFGGHRSCPAGCQCRQGFSQADARSRRGLGGACLIRATSARKIARRFQRVDGDDGERQADQLRFGEVLTRAGIELVGDVVDPISVSVSAHSSAARSRGV